VKLVGPTPISSGLRGATLPILSDLIRECTSRSEDIETPKAWERRDGPVYELLGCSSRR
jgi:hypothetical protein